MEIKKVISDKKEFLELLLLADEQESMIAAIWNVAICLSCMITD